MPVLIIAWQYTLVEPSAAFKYVNGAVASPGPADVITLWQVALSKLFPVVALLPYCIAHPLKPIAFIFAALISAVAFTVPKAVFFSVK